MDEHVPRPDLSLLRLRVFAAVVERGGYTTATRDLRLSQPTVSFHVQALERAFGARLVVYRGRRVHLTAAGEALHALARRTLRDVEEPTAQIAGLRAGRAGRVCLGASIALEQAFFFFDAVVAPFTSAHPAVELALHFGTSRGMVEAVRAPGPSGLPHRGIRLRRHRAAPARRPRRRGRRRPARGRCGRSGR